MMFRTNSTERFRIDSSGKVSVGDVTSNGYGSSLGQVRIINDASSTPASFALFGYGNTTTGDTFAKIQFAQQESGYGGQVTAEIGALAVGTDERGTDLIFKTRPNTSGSSASERLRIASTGGLGIAGANYGTSGQVLTSGGSGAAVSWATASGGPTHYTKFTNEPSQSGNVTLSNWDVFSPGLSPTINTAVSHSSGIFSFPVTGIWECYANVLWSFDGGATEQRLEIHGTTDNGSNWDILTRQYQCWVNTNTTKYQSLPTPPLLLDITDTSNCKVKFKVAGGPAGAQTAGDDNEWYTGCHFIRWGDT
mgnify:CR=1 FL=1